MEITSEQFKKDTRQYKDINEYLKEDEIVVWADYPDKKTFVKANLGIPFPFALIWLLFDSMFIIAMISTDGVPLEVVPILIIFFLLHMTPVWIFLFGLVKGLKNSQVRYYITNKRIIEEQPKRAIKYSSINIKDIKNIQTKLLKSYDQIGNIMISTEHSKLNLYAIIGYNQIAETLNHIKEVLDREPKNYNNLKVTSLYVCDYCGNTFRSDNGKCINCGAKARKKD